MRKKTEDITMILIYLIVIITLLVGTIVTILWK